MIDLTRRRFLFGLAAVPLVVPAVTHFVMPKSDILIGTCDTAVAEIEWAGMRLADISIREAYLRALARSVRRTSNEIIEEMFRAGNGFPGGFAHIGESRA